MHSALEAARSDWPVFGLSDDIRPALSAAMLAGEDSVLVTLYRARGGAPRGVGAQMLMTRCSIAGYLSGGCIEADVTRHALAVLADGKPRWLVYGRGGPVDIRLPCGGSIELLVERIRSNDPVASRLLELTDRRVAALWLSNGEVRACLAQSGDSDGAVARLEDSLRDALSQARKEQGGAGRSEATHAIYRYAEPRRRLVVLGQDPATLAMALLARQVGMEVVLVRPKGPLTPPPVPEIRYLRQAPADALGRIGLDPWTAVAVAMHHDENDHDALVAALPSCAGYVGLLGSARRLPRILARLAGAGVAAEVIGRLRAPIGLSLGGHSPWEIATGVIAEIAQVMNASHVKGAPAAEASEAA